MTVMVDRTEDLKVAWGAINRALYDSKRRIDEAADLAQKVPSTSPAFPVASAIYTILKGAVA